MEDVLGAGADGTLDADQLVGLTAALGRVIREAEIDHDGRAAAEQREVGAAATVQSIVGGPAVEDIAARAAAEGVLAAEPFEPGFPISGRILATSSVDLGIYFSVIKVTE